MSSQSFYRHGAEKNRKLFKKSLCPICFGQDWLPNEAGSCFGVLEVHSVSTIRLCNLSRSPLVSLSPSSNSMVGQEMSQRTDHRLGMWETWV